jgi:hypothetical protein
MSWGDAQCSRTYRGTRCRAVRSAHVGGQCPGGGGVYLSHTQPLSRASTSLLDTELQWLLDTFGELLAGNDAKAFRALARRPELAGVAAKVMGMRQSMRARREAGL